MKFPFKKAESGVIVWDLFGNIDRILLLEFLNSIKEGKDMEMLIREKIDWDAVQMKRFFEGPVVAFVHECYARRGVALGRGDVRAGLLGKFLGWCEPNEFGQTYPLSRTELDTPKDGLSPRQRWTTFLTDIDNYCKDEFGCGLPSADNTDTGD